MIDPFGKYSVWILPFASQKMVSMTICADGTLFNFHTCGGLPLVVVIMKNPRLVPGGGVYEKIIFSASILIKKKKLNCYSIITLHWKNKLCMSRWGTRDYLNTFSVYFSISLNTFSVMWRIFSMLSVLIITYVCDKLYNWSQISHQCLLTFVLRCFFVTSY